ncbi:MAG: hypothetical protein AAFV53_14015 [Myxococcota bacterium]
MSTWLERLLLSTDPQKNRKGMEHIRSTISEPSRRSLAGALARHGALVEALEQIQPMPWPSDLSRWFACACAQAALDIRSTRHQVEPFCSIALHRTEEVARGNLSVDELDGAAFMARSSISSGVGLAAEVVLAACALDAKQGAIAAAHRLRLLGQEYQVTSDVAAPPALRQTLLTLIAAV